MRGAGRPEGRGWAPRLGNSREARSWPGPGPGPRTPDAPGPFRHGASQGFRRHLPSQPARPAESCACASVPPLWAGLLGKTCSIGLPCEGRVPKAPPPAYRPRFRAVGPTPLAGDADGGSEGSARLPRAAVGSIVGAGQHLGGPRSLCSDIGPALEEEASRTARVLPTRFQNWRTLHSASAVAARAASLAVEDRNMPRPCP